MTTDTEDARPTLGEGGSILQRGVQRQGNHVRLRRGSCDIDEQCPTCTRLVDETVDRGNPVHCNDTVRVNPTQHRQGTDARRDLRPDITVGTTRLLEGEVVHRLRVTVQVEECRAHHRHVGRRKDRTNLLVIIQTRGRRGVSQVIPRVIRPTRDDEVTRNGRSIRIT